MELWKNIEEFPGYQVSNLGRVRSYVNNRHGFTDNPHILKQTRVNRGYCVVQLGRGNRRLVHRLVADAYISNPNNLPIVRHLDDNPSNNMAKNLAWGTQVDNMQDCVKHGRLVGDTSEAINATKKPVRAKSLNGDFIKEYDSIHSAARDLNVWPQHICSVIHGKISQTGGYVFSFINKEGH